MALINDLGQKIKGKTQQVNGEFQIQTGHPVAGGLEKAKGKINETFADIKVRSKTNRSGARGY